MNDELGVKDAAETLEAMRLELDARQVVAFFDLRETEVAMVVDRDGVGVFVNGQAVPIQRTQG